MRCADATQKNLHTNFSSTHFLGSQSRCLNLIDWITLFRRNLDLFVDLYLGIKLYLYQKIIIHLLGICNSFVLVGARAIAKSFMIAIYACCIAILYPNSIVVVASATKGQSRLIVEEKIRKELMPKSAALRNEIAKITNNQNETVVEFKNNSQIIVVPANDNARGHRSTSILYEEFRMIPKKTVDEILSPFAITRNRPFMTKSEYMNVPELIEESKEVYISSAWFCNHWMWTHMQTTVKDMFAEKASILMPLDYCLTLKHGLKTRAQLIRDKNKFDPITWAIEYENTMVRENTSAFFTIDMLEKRRVLKKAFYPRRIWDNKVKFGIAKQPGEIRLVSCDIAMVDKKENDNSISSCLRLLPERIINDEEDNEHIEYHIQVVYLEHSRGGETIKQATRIKQLFNDFDADYCVLDIRSFGISIYDALAKTIYDEERDVEYKPWVCINDENTANRIKNPNALPILYAFTGTSKRNSEMAINMRAMLIDGKVDFLVNINEAMEEVLPKIREYADTNDADEQLYFENPYIETASLINEMLGLQQERSDTTGIIRLSEKSTAMKDRYVSVAMGCYFASELERGEVRSEDEELGTYMSGTCVTHIDL